MCFLVSSLLPGNDVNVNTPHPSMSDTTDMCVFGYNDTHGYTSIQKCMAHEDDSLLTIVPKSTFPGLHILDHGARQWVDVEAAMPDDSCMVVYPGRALALITNEHVSATTHRVVRTPGQTRFSLPFLMKPNKASILRHLQSPRLSPTTATSEEEKKRSKNGYALDTCPPISYKDFRNSLGWERTQNRLARITKREAQTTAESSVFGTKAQPIPSDKGQQMVETLAIMMAHE